MNSEFKVKYAEDSTKLKAENEQLREENERLKDELALLFVQLRRACEANERSLHNLRVENERKRGTHDKAATNHN